MKPEDAKTVHLPLPLIIYTALSELMKLNDAEPGGDTEHMMLDMAWRSIMAVLDTITDEGQVDWARKTADKLDYLDEEMNIHGARVGNGGMSQRYSLSYSLCMPVGQGNRRGDHRRS